VYTISENFTEDFSLN